MASEKTGGENLTVLNSAIGVWNVFIQNTGLHGINKVIFSGGMTRRIIFWALLVLSASIYLIYTVIMELKNYQRYPTTITSFPVNYDEMIFPAITICNLNALNKSAIKDDLRNHMYYQNISNVFKPSSNSDYTSPDVNWSDPFYQENRYFDTMTKNDILQENKDIMESLVSRVLFDHTLIDVKTLYTTKITNIGPCLTSKPEKVLRTRQSGPYFNYIIELNLDKANNYYGNFLGEGAQLMVHDPVVDPDFDNRGGKYFLQPGTDVYAEITKNEYLGYPYESMPGIYCRKQTSDGKEYNYAICVKDCFAKFINKTCGCLHFFHDNEVFCSKYQVASCVKDASALFVRDLNLQKICDCPIACSYSHYKVSMTSVAAPSDLYMSNLLNLFDNMTINKFREEGILVHIYFNGLFTYISKQVPQYSGVGDIFAKLGGQMGLFLGASIITVVEVLELFLGLFCLCCKRKDQVATAQKG